MARTAIARKKKASAGKLKPVITGGDNHFFVALPSMNVIQFVPSTETSNFMV